MIGGLILATVATLVFVPCVFSLLHHGAPRSHTADAGDDAQCANRWRVAETCDGRRAAMHRSLGRRGFGRRLAVGIYRGIRGRVAAETALAHVTEAAADPDRERGPSRRRPARAGDRPARQRPGLSPTRRSMPAPAAICGSWYFDIGAHVKTRRPAGRDRNAGGRRTVASGAAPTWRPRRPTLTLAESTWKRDQTLFDKTLGLGTRSATTRSAPTRPTRRSSHRKQADVSRLQRLQSYEKVYAPFDGIITARNTDVGALIDAGAAASGRELFHLSAIDKVRIFTAVPEIYTRSVQHRRRGERHARRVPGRVLPRHGGPQHQRHRSELARADGRGRRRQSRTAGCCRAPMPSSISRCRATRAPRASRCRRKALIFRKEGLRVARRAERASGARADRRSGATMAPSSKSSPASMRATR